MNCRCLPKELLLLTTSLLNKSSIFSLGVTCKFYRLLVTHHSIDLIDSLDDIVVDSISNGHIDMLKWLINPQDVIDKQNRIKYCEIAAESGNIDMLKYLGTNDPTVFGLVRIMAGAVNNGQLDVVKWLREEHNCPMCKDILHHPIINGHFDVVKYLFLNNCPRDECACGYAAMYGNLEILKWLHENGCPWDRFCYVNAEMNGHQEVLEYLRENECVDVYLPYYRYL